TVRGIDPAMVQCARGAEADVGAVGVASAQGGIDRAHQKPVAAARGDVAIEPGGFGDAGDEEIYAAVVIDVAAGQASTDVGGRAEGRILFRNVGEFSVASAGLVVEEL